MAIKSAPTHGVYHHRAPAHDQRRPNILLSSDIPYKIALCVSDLNLQLDASSSRLEDLAKSIKFFDLTLELNSVILRNVNITISKLLSQNQIFVARSKRAPTSALISQGNFKFPEVWQSVLDMRNRDEIFVVNSRLYIKKFTVDLHPPHETCLEFQDNEDFSSILAYDKDLLHHLKAYISQRLIAELEHKLDPLIQSPDYQVPQQSPPDLIGIFNDLTLESGETVLDLANRSLDSSDYSSRKQLVDHDDFSYSFEDLRLLQSDDSGKCTIDDESEMNSPLIDTECFLTTDLVDNYTFKEDIERSETKQVSPGYSDGDTVNLDDDCNQLQPAIQIERKTLRNRGSIAKEDHFVSEIENLRHNFPKFDSDNSLSQTLATDGLFDINESPTCDTYVDDVPLSPKKEEVTFVHSSPRKPPKRERTVHKQSSFSFIDKDDGHGLNYAFKDSSVPEYIKENKKFKFIKIGKVQKFVSMFEERTEPASNSSSRIGTRPSSPKRELH